MYLIAEIGVRERYYDIKYITKIYLHYVKDI